MAKENTFEVDTSFKTETSKKLILTNVNTEYCTKYLNNFGTLMEQRFLVYF